MSKNPLKSKFIRDGSDVCAGIKAERKTARRLTASLTPASGSLAGAKGDMTKNDWLIENKSTVKDTLCITHDWLIKISQEALEKLKIPALTFQFTRPDGTPEKRGSWVVIPEELFKELVELTREDK